MVKFIVLEIQTNSDGTVGTLINSYDNRADAESKYHLVLSAAALSQLPLHACVMMTNDGQVINRHHYGNIIVDVPEVIIE